MSNPIACPKCGKQRASHVFNGAEVSVPTDEGRYKLRWYDGSAVFLECTCGYYGWYRLMEQQWCQTTSSQPPKFHTATGAERAMSFALDQKKC